MVFKDRKASSSWFQTAVPQGHSAFVIGEFYLFHYNCHVLPFAVFNSHVISTDICIWRLNTTMATFNQVNWFDHWIVLPAVPHIVGLLFEIASQSWTMHGSAARPPVIFKPSMQMYSAVVFSFNICMDWWSSEHDSEHQTCCAMHRLWKRLIQSDKYVTIYLTKYNRSSSD